MRISKICTTTHWKPKDNTRRREGFSLTRQLPLRIGRTDGRRRSFAWVLRGLRSSVKLREILVQPTSLASPNWSPLVKSLISNALGRDTLHNSAPKSEWWLWGRTGRLRVLANVKRKPRVTKMKEIEEKMMYLVFHLSPWDPWMCGSRIDMTCNAKIFSTLGALSWRRYVY